MNLYPGFPPGLLTINLFSPSVNMHILLTDLSLFLIILVERICLKIKFSLFGDHICYSPDLYV